MAMTDWRDKESYVDERFSAVIAILKNGK